MTDAEWKITRHPGKQEKAKGTRNTAENLYITVTTGLYKVVLIDRLKKLDFKKSETDKIVLWKLWQSKIKISSKDLHNRLDSSYTYWTAGGAVWWETQGSQRCTGCDAKFLQMW